MSTTYQYSITDDTKLGQWNKERLRQEIVNDATIAVLLEGLTEVSDNIEATFAADLPTAQKDRLDYIVSQHEGLSATEYDIVHVEPTGKTNTHVLVAGSFFEPDLGGDSNHDVSFDHDRYVQGVIIDVYGRTKGDYIEVTFQHPNPEIGELAKFAETVHVPPAGSMNVISEGASKMPAGVIMRLTYHSVATEGEKPEVYVAYRMWLEH